jgi:hypothetical protein
VHCINVRTDWDNFKLTATPEDPDGVEKLWSFILASREERSSDRAFPVQKMLEELGRCCVFQVRGMITIMSERETTERFFVAAPRPAAPPPPPPLLRLSPPTHALAVSRWVSLMAHHLPACLPAERRGSWDPASSAASMCIPPGAGQEGAGDDRSGWHGLAFVRVRAVFACSKSPPPATPYGVRGQPSRRFSWRELARHGWLRVRVEIRGSQKCRNVGESQSALIMIQPLL